LIANLTPNKGRFSAVVRVLYADGGKFDPDEKKFLDKLAVKLDIF